VSVWKRERERYALVGCTAARGNAESPLRRPGGGVCVCVGGRVSLASPCERKTLASPKMKNQLMQIRHARRGGGGPMRYEAKHFVRVG
jgi:hypothetical protein